MRQEYNSWVLLLVQVLSLLAQQVGPSPPVVFALGRLPVELCSLPLAAALPAIRDPHRSISC